MESSPVPRNWASRSRRVRVKDVVKVDVYLPGCPPSAEAIHYVLSELLEGRIPVLTG